MDSNPRSPVSEATLTRLPRLTATEGDRVMARHRVFLAAFLVKPNRPFRAARPEILDFIFNAAPMHTKL
jgi:hypothetical protein